MSRFVMVLMLMPLLSVVPGCHSDGKGSASKSAAADGSASGQGPASVPSVESPAHGDSGWGDSGVVGPDGSAGAGKKTILFFGNSLTAGYGVGAEEAFPALIGKRIDSLRWPYQVVNAGLSGETSSGGKSRIGWILRQRVDVFVLELGANDGLRGIPVSATAANLQAILDSVKARYPAARFVLAGMQIPPSMGNKYAADFKAVFPRLAEKNKLSLIPFILEGVGGVPELNQDDGIHPTVKGQRILAENVWKVLRGLLVSEGGVRAQDSMLKRDSRGKF